MHNFLYLSRLKLNKLSEFIYKFFLYAYSGGFLVSLPAIYLKKMKRSLKNKNYRKRWSERFGDTNLRLKSSIWIHSVSVGESVSAEPLVKKILQEYPNENIVNHNYNTYW